MTEEEARELRDSIYPVGKERWIKVRILNQDKTMNSLRWNDKNAEELGYEVTAITLLDEHIPQISALMGVKDRISGMLYGRVEQSVISAIRYDIDGAIDSLKARAIVEKEIPGEFHQP